MTPSIAIAFVIWIGVSKGNKITFNSFFRMFESAINNIAPVTMMVFGGLAISEVFQKIGIGDAIAQMMEGLHIELWMVALVFPVVFAFLGMFLEGLTIIYMLGNVFIIMAHSVGINPILAAAMLPVVVTVMGYMTPPFAITFHICLGIADADFLKATKIIILWCVTQYIVQALILFGVLPVPGLVPFA
jgi:TRAP-type C4-dicarboxylate transport system permease large subunit